MPKLLSYVKPKGLNYLNPTYLNERQFFLQWAYRITPEVIVLWDKNFQTPSSVYCAIQEYIGNDIGGIVYKSPCHSPNNMIY